MRTPTDLTDKNYGRLTALSISHKTENKQVYWNCVCSCGNLKIVAAHHLVSGTTKSCGCLRKEVAEVLGKRSYRREFSLEDIKPQAINRLYYRYKYRSVKDSIVFELTLDQFSSIIIKDCFYCAALPDRDMVINRVAFKYNGIDRKDNDEGYILGNVVPCCTTCNYAKRTMGIKEFIQWARRVSEVAKEKEWYL